MPFSIKDLTTSKPLAVIAGAAIAVFTGAAVISSLPSAPQATAKAVAEESDTIAVRYRSVKIDGVTVAYREAGAPNRPTVLLLHGFPTSSQQYRKLIPALAKRYHVLAPDYPGFGASDMPSRETFKYTFANYANVVQSFLKQKGVKRYALYLMDYGAPIGFRVFAKAPERVTAFIIQNGNAYVEGLQKFWDPIKAYWADPKNPAKRNALRQFLTIGATKWQYTHGVSNVEAVSPDNWHTDQFLLDRPGSKDIQLDLFLDYGTNVGHYKKWQALFRRHQPPTLIVWGKNDQIFPAAGAHPYKRDLKTMEFHLLNTGHFALEEYGAFIAARMLAFLKRHVSAG